MIRLQRPLKSIRRDKILLFTSYERVDQKSILYIPTVIFSSKENTITNHTYGQLNTLTKRERRSARVFVRFPLCDKGACILFTSKLWSDHETGRTKQCIIHKSERFLPLADDRFARESGASRVVICRRRVCCWINNARVLFVHPGAPPRTTTTYGTNQQRVTTAATGGVPVLCRVHDSAWCTGAEARTTAVEHHHAALTRPPQSHLRKHVGRPEL